MVKTNACVDIQNKGTGSEGVKDRRQLDTKGWQHIPPACKLWQCHSNSSKNLNKERKVGLFFGCFPQHSTIFSYTGSGVPGALGMRYPLWTLFKASRLLKPGKEWNRHNPSCLHSWGNFCFHCSSKQNVILKIMLDFDAIPNKTV